MIWRAVSWEETFGAREPACGPMMRRGYAVACQLRLTIFDNDLDNNSNNYGSDNERRYEPGKIHIGVIWLMVNVVVDHIIK